MNKYFYPIFKLPTFYERDYVKEELPLWVKWWLLGKAGRELSEILTGSEFTLLYTLNRKFKILQIKGNTMQDGEPTPENPVPIKNVTGQANIKIQNKNLFDESIFKQYDTKEDDEAYKMYNSRVYNKDLTPNISFKENTSYTLIYIAKQSSGNPRLAINYDDGTIAECPNTAMSINYTQYMLVTPSNKKIKNISFKYGGTGYVYIKKNSVMVLEGAYTSETIPSYVPHKEQNYPFTFAEGQFLADDEELQDNGEYKEWGKIILDGTQDIQTVNWRPSETSVGWIYPYDLTSNKNNYSNTDIPDILCNKLIRKTYSQLYNKVDEGIGLVPSTAGIAGIVVRISNPNLTTKEAINSYLAQNPLTVIYKKAQPYTIPYNSTQASQYEAIKNARSYDDITYISGSSNELAPELKIQYWKERGSEE